MKLTLTLFKYALNVAKNNDPISMDDALMTMQQFLIRVTKMYDDSMRELREVAVQFKTKENEIHMDMQRENLGNIQVWVPIMQQQMDSYVFSDIKKTTVREITKSRETLHMHELSIEETKLRVMEKANETKETLALLERTETQIFVLETAIKLVHFFEENGYHYQDVADYEIEKYYALYQKGGGISG